MPAYRITEIIETTKETVLLAESAEEAFIQYKNQGKNRKAIDFHQETNINVEENE